MNNLNVVDRFLDTFARYINSGFGLLGGEVAWLSATLIAIDVTLAALFWTFGQSDDIFAKLVKKVLYVGAFAFILNNFNWLASIVFRSFAGLGLTASGSGMTEAQLLQPGRLASAGVGAGRPLLDQIGEMGGFPEFFWNVDVIAVLLIAWLIIVVAFFVLAGQLCVTLIEFKLVTLAGFVLVPFAFWNKTAFLAERVLGTIVSSGIKVLVLAVIVGIGSGLFEEFRLPPGTEVTIDHALAITLGALTLLGLGIFGPAIATGLVSGAPQLGAGSVAGTALGVAGVGAAGAAVVTGGAALAAGGAGAAFRGATSLASGARAAYAEGGIVGVARAGAGAVGNAARGAASRVFGSGGSAAGAPDGPPAWAKRMQRRQSVVHGASVATHTLRSGDRGGPGATPNLPKED